MPGVPPSNNSATQVGEVRKRPTIYYEPTPKEMENVILRAFRVQTAQGILPRARRQEGHITISGLQKSTYERAIDALNHLCPNNILNIEYIHGVRASRNLLIVSNRHPLGDRLSTCLAESLAAQINQTFGRGKFGGPLKEMAWTRRQKTWDSRENYTGDNNVCEYRPDNQVRIISPDWMPAVVIYVVPQHLLRATMTKMEGLVYYNPCVTTVIIIAVQQERSKSRELIMSRSDEPDARVDLPCLPSEGYSTVEAVDRISISVLRADEGIGIPPWSLNDVEVFPAPTAMSISVSYRDLTLMPWALESEGPLCALSFGELTELANSLCNESAVAQ